jgi:hypothetical protein
MPGKRRFLIEHCDIKLPSGYTGSFESSGPYQAASKAAHAVFRMTKTRKQDVKFTIRETTMGSAKKEFSYIGTKTVLDKPIPRVNKKGEPLLDAKGKQIMIKHKYSVKSVSA